MKNWLNFVSHPRLGLIWALAFTFSIFWSCSQHCKITPCFRGVQDSQLHSGSALLRDSTSDLRSVQRLERRDDASVPWTAVWKCGHPHRVRFRISPRRISLRRTGSVRPDLLFHRNLVLALLSRDKYLLVILKIIFKVLKLENFPHVWVA